jgi:hypothetical protein
VVLLALFPSSAALARHVVSSVLPVNVQVSADSFVAHSEPVLAQNPNDARDLVGGSKFFTDARRYRFTIGTYVSSDAGGTWHDNGPLPGFAAYRTTSDISFAFAPGGRVVYACVLAVAGKRSGIFVSRSEDGGRTWGAPSTVFLDRSGSTFSDKPWIAVDSSHGAYRGRVYVAWNLDGTAVHAADPDAGVTPQTVPTGKATGPDTAIGIAVARSTDEGRSFSRPVIVSRFQGDDFALGAIPAVGPAGRLYVTFLRLHGSGVHRTYDLAMTGSSDGGRSFSPTHAIVRRVYVLPNRLPHGSFRNFSLPALAVSPLSSTLMVAWADMRHGDADIMKVTSANGGRSWGLLSRVNNDPLRDGADQFQPQLAVANDGSFTCSWFDRRYDPGDRYIDVVVAQSRNNGRTFGPNVRVTARSWDPAIDAPHPNPKRLVTFIGDYQGLAVDDATVHPFWNDTQNGRTQEIRTESVPVAMLAGS